MPPAHGKYITFWNWKVGYSEPYKGRIKPGLFNTIDIPGVIAVGIQPLNNQITYIKAPGDIILMRDTISEKEFYIIDFGKQPAFPSLFLYQQQKRLGKIIM
ncbi:MAG: hypothetical protein HC906_17545 [Bacteroidales bacterium]|nr:hypothetical protein [Bacteroidales bacterium]